MRSVLGRLLLVAVVTSSSLVGQTAPSTLAAELDAAVRQRIQRTLDATSAVGLAVGIVAKGEVVFTEGFGWADREAKIPATKETRFRWASISKCLTSIAALQQVERGHVGLDADVRGIVLGLAPGPALSLRQLLTNTGGVGHYAELGRLDRAWTERVDLYPDDKPFDARAAVAIFGTVPLAHPPGSKYLYSTFGFVLAGAVVDATARRHERTGYVDWIDREISRPMGLTTLRPDYTFEAIPERARGYERVAGVIRPEGEKEETDVSWKLPGGGFHSSIGDLARFGRGVVNGIGLRRESWDLAWSHTGVSNGGPGYGYGFGFRGKATDPGGRVISHTGAQSRTRTLLILHPERKAAVALMTNSTWVDASKDLRPLADDLVRLLAP